MQFALFVRNSLNPQKFTNTSLSPDDFQKWKNYIIDQIALLNIHFSITPFSEQEIQFLITQVVDLSNTVNSYIFRKFKIIRSHPNADLINKHYIFTLDLLDGLTLTLNTLFPIAAGKVKISDSFLYDTLSALKKDFYKLTLHLKKSGVEIELANVILFGISNLINKKHITRNDKYYITEIISAILVRDGLDNKQLADLLISYDFYTVEFYNYCINIWRINLDDIPGLHEQREMLLLEKDRILTLENSSTIMLPNNNKRLFVELNEFLDEKSSVVKKMVKLRRRLIKDNLKSKNGSRFLINLPVTQFGLFLRMQIEKGILVKENLGDLFKFFATHFYTPNAEFISADSLQKKSTDVEFATAQKLKGHLIGMLNWLNTNYNLSNYN